MGDFVPSRSRIEIDCRTAGWQRHRARYIRQALQSSLDYAEDYIERVLEIPSTVQRVTPYLAWRKKTQQARGGVILPTQFMLDLSRPEVDHKKLEALDIEITPVCVHEMIHCIRASFFPDMNVLLENIATEGLAYYAQAMAEHEMFDVALEATVLHDELDAETLLEELYDEPRLLESVPDTLYSDRELGNEWLFNRQTNEYFHWGQRLGIWCVKSWVEDYNYSLASVIEMPAEEIITL